jgi:hypothetical protein
MVLKKQHECHSLMAGAALLVAAAAPAFAADVTVSGFSDNTDACTTSVSPVSCPSLRSAIIYTNQNAGADTITLPAGTYTLSIQGVDETWSGSGTTADPYVPAITADATRGDLDITDDLTITGAGAAQTLIQWDPAIARDSDPATGDRIFHVQVAAGATANISSVVIQDLSLNNGQAGVVPDNTAEVTPTNYNIEVLGDGSIWQFRRMGGAIALGEGASVVKYVPTVHGPGGGGGGGGGGEGQPGGPGGEETSFTIDNVTLNHVVVAGSWAGADGGGLYSAVPATVENSVITGNFSGANGGGIYNDGAMTVTNTTIGKFFATQPASLQAPGVDLTTGNEAENGGGLFDTGFHTTVINASAINGNTAVGGGGVASRSGVIVNFTNTTVSGNAATDVGGGITTNGSVNLTNATITANSASTDATGGGGGLNAFGSGTYSFVNTILSNNTKGATGATVSSNCGCSGGSASCPPGTMVSRGHNLENGNSCSLGLSGDLTDTDPLLGNLASNNSGLIGLTETQALPQVSPAIEAGDDSACPNNDQRGSIRPANGNPTVDNTATCDIGAFELFVHTADLHINNMVVPDTVKKGNDVNISVEAHNGPATTTATGVSMAVTLPASFTYKAAAATGAGTVNTCSYANNVVTCNIGDLANDQTATVNVVATATTATGPNDNPFTVSAAVSATTPSDPIPENNSHSAQVRVTGDSNLAITGSASATKLTVNGGVTMSYTVTNQGPSDATLARFYTSLPSGTSLVSATADNNGTCTATDNDVVCELGTIPLSAPTVNVTVKFTGNQAGSYAIAASVAADETDPDSSDNTTTTTVNFYNESGGGAAVNPLLVLSLIAWAGIRRRQQRRPG